MGHTNDQDDHLLCQDRIDDDVILAGMEPAKFGKPFKLAGWFAEGIHGKQIQTPCNSPTNVFGQRIDLPLCFVR